MAKKLTPAVNSTVNSTVTSIKSKLAQPFSALSDARVQKVAEGAQKVWYAGIGAVARVQTEGEKLVLVVAKEAKVLEAEGKKLAQSRTKQARQFTIAKSNETMAKVIDIKNRAVYMVENQVSDRTQKVLSAFGVPSSQNIRELTDAIDALRKNVEALQKAKKAA